MQESDSKAHNPRMRGGIKRTPTVLQMEAVECGAASLAMILGYYGKTVSLEELRIRCGVSRDGSNARNLLHAARSYGLEAKGYSKSIDRLSSIRMPCIIFWNFNHFVVLEGIRKGYAYLNDPAEGRYRVSMDDFSESYTGVVLTFEPGPGFERGRHKETLFEALKRRVRHSRGPVGFIFTVSLLLIIPGLVIPAFTQVFIDKYLINHYTDWIPPLLLVMAGVMVMNMGLIWLKEHFLLRLRTKMSLSHTSEFFWHILRLPAVFFTQRSAGEIGSRLQLNSEVARMLAGDIANSALNVIMVVFFGLVMLLYDPLLTLVGLGTAGLNVLALRWVSSKRRELNRKLVNENGKLIGTTVYGIRMIETLKASGRESDFFTQWSGYLAKVLGVRQELGWLNRRLSVVPFLLMSLNTTTVLCFGALRVMDGHLTLGMLVAFTYLMARFMGPVNELVNFGIQLQNTEAQMNRLDDVMKYETAPEFRHEAAEAETGAEEKLEGSLELHNLTFGYSRLADPLIRDFSLKLEPGMRVALVGGSGSGKSTIARLISGLYEPWEGEILFDGKTRPEVPRSAIVNSLAMVDQKILLFEGSVKENISFWDHTLDETSMIRAAKDACIHDFLNSRPGGYDGPVLEGGRNFSGGQCQRLEIARSLAINPRILILDEATSALDPNTEKEVIDNIRRRGCTCILVAHRLSTIRDCDEIIVMDKGVIVERGTHEELYAKEGHYFHLIESD